VKKQNNSKPLFLNTKNQTQSEQTPEKKKRDRPKKNPTEQPKQEVKTQPVKKETKKEITQKQSNIKPISGWKDFLKQKPDALIPVEFYVDNGKQKQDIFRGYVSRDGMTVTDEPYRLVVLSKKYGNLFYRFIYGCPNLNNCPNDFPSCDLCKRKKK